MQKSIIEREEQEIRINEERGTRKQRSREIETDLDMEQALSG